MPDVSEVLTALPGQLCIGTNGDGPRRDSVDDVTGLMRSTPSVVPHGVHRPSFQSRRATKRRLRCPWGQWAGRGVVDPK